MTAPRPLFSLVQGSDFGRSIAWSKRHGNPLVDEIRRRVAALKPVKASGPAKRVQNSSDNFEPTGKLTRGASW